MRTTALSFLLWIIPGLVPAVTLAACSAGTPGPAKHYITVHQPDTIYFCVTPLPGQRMIDHPEIAYMGPGWTLWREGRCLDGRLRLWYVRREGVYEVTTHSSPEE